MAFPLQRRAYLGLLLLLAVPLAVAQQLHATEEPDPQVPLGTSPAASSSTQPAPDSTQNAPVPKQPSHQWNAGLTISGFHESTTGWATLTMPAAGYTINDTFAIDAAIPIYMYRLAESRSTRPRVNAQLINQRGEPGDVIIGFHAQFIPRDRKSVV